MSTKYEYTYMENISDFHDATTYVPVISYDHIIPKSKLFLVQMQLEMADLRNHCGSRGSRYGKRISGAQ